MSEIARLRGEVKLSINENDHNPPHLHMRCPEGSFKLFFHDLSVYVKRGNAVKARKDIAEVQAWMKLHMDELYERWEARDRDEKVMPIE